MALNVAVALLVFIIPGFLISWAAGIRPHWAVVGAIPVTAGVWGVLAALYGAFGIPFTLLTVLIGTVCMLLLALVWRLLFRKRIPKDTWYRDWRCLGTPILPVLGVVAGAGLMMRRGLATLSSTPHGVQSIYEGWDVLWHASVIRFIMEEHVASATHMGELQNVENHKQLFYPTAWHSMIFMFREVSQISPIAALNISAMVLPAVGLAMTVSLLAWIAVRNRSRKAGIATITAAFLAPIIAAGILPMYYVGFYVGMWPYVAATAFIGPLIWMFRKIPDNAVAILPAALAFVGVAMMHPAPVVYAGIIVVLWILGEESYRWASDKKRALKTLAYMGSAIVLAVATLVPQFLIGSGQSGEVEAFTDQQDVSRWQSWMTVLLLQTRHTRDFGIEWWLIWLASAGMIALVLWRRRIWIVVAYWIFATIAVDSVLNFSGPVGGATRIIGALHYNTTHRLIFPVAMLSTVFAAAAIGILLQLLFQTGRKAIGIRLGAGTVVVLLIGWQIAPLTQTHQAKAYEYLLSATYNPRLIDQKELNAYDWLAKQPKAYDGMILNSPDEGSGWMYAYNGLKPLHRHFLWPNVDWTDATMTLFWHPDQIGRGLPPEKGSEADQAAQLGLPTKGLTGDRSREKNLADLGVDKLKINYIISSPPHYWHYQNDVLAHGASLYRSPGVTPVYQDGTTYIYAVNAHFTKKELDDILAHSPRPPHSPPVQTPTAGPSPMTSLDPKNPPLP